MSDSVSTIAQATASRTNATRIADHQEAMASLRAFAVPLAAPDPVLVVDMRLAALVEVYNRDWEEFDAEASVLAAVAAEALREMRGT